LSICAEAWRSDRAEYNWSVTLRCGLEKTPDHRAKGVARVNQIIGDSLDETEVYLSCR
jgi:hypothetical protein